MPVYLLHGFRWPRPLIRIHIILQNLDDAAAEWLMAPATTDCLTDNFRELFPKAMTNLPRLRFIEQYDPLDESPTAASQPYAYVADVVHEIKLGLAVDDVMGRGITGSQWDALLELRDELAAEEKVGWYVVVCGDEERLAEDEGEGYDDGDAPSEASLEEIPLPPVSAPVVSRKPLPVRKDQVQTLDRHDRFQTPDRHDQAQTPDRHDQVQTPDRHDQVRRRGTSDSGPRPVSCATDDTVRKISSRTDSAVGKLMVEQRRDRTPGSRASMGSSDVQERGSPRGLPSSFRRLVGSLKKRASQGNVNGKRVVTPRDDGTAPPVPSLGSPRTRY